MYDLATRGAVITLRALGYSNTQVSQTTGVPNRTVTNIYKKACSRGFDPNIRPLAIKDEYVEDVQRTGRPGKDAPKVIEDN
ncbi:hypothetical protein EV356DRAFT_454440 [Viridothelium virens]|uniref:HTH luxR-type domain-containing protein n=1 Tax=Viridothelium virens TaxID=1048519 RepID=A0A6A6GXT9_VIRVR|nr:hypothetical protein EV356DRAFT_454440 [Viridothelium virens]